MPTPKSDRPVNARAILEALARVITDREHDAHEALQVGGYLPFDPEFEIEIPLSLCYAARAVLAEAEDARSTSAR